MKLVAKLALLFLLFTLLSVAVAAIYTYSKGGQLTLARIEGFMSAVAELKQDELERWVDTAQSSLYYFAQGNHARKYAQNLASIERGTPTFEETRQRLVENHFQPFLTRNDSFQSLSLVSAADGTVLASTVPEWCGCDCSGEDFFRQRGAGTYLQAPGYSEWQGELSFLVSTPVEDESGNPAAFLVGQLNRAEMQEILIGGARLLPSEDSFLVSRDLGMVTDSRYVGEQSEEDSLHPPIVNACLQGGSGKGFYTNSRGLQALGVYRWMPEYQMCLIMEVEQADALSLATAIRNNILKTILLLIIMGGVFSVVISWIFTRPVQTLIRGTRRFADGDLEYNIPVQSRDEIGELAGALNQMSADLQRSLSESQRRNQLLEALSRAAQRIQMASSVEQIYQVAGEELTGLGFNLIILKLDGNRKMLYMAFFKLAPQAAELLEQIKSFQLSTLEIPYEEESLFGAIATQDKAKLIDPSDPYLKNIIPTEYLALLHRTSQTAEIGRVILAPLVHNGDPSGFLCLNGHDLNESDLAAVNTFAKQISVSIEKIELLRTLRANEAYFRALIEHSSDIISILDLEGNIVYKSPSAEVILGYPTQTMTEANFLEFIHPQDRARVWQGTRTKPSSEVIWHR